MGRRFQEFRKEWKETGEAIDKRNADRARRDEKAAKAKPKPTADEIAIMNNATIAGNIANSIVPDCNS